MKKIYTLELNCELVGAYETKEKAMIEGLIRYTKWLEGYANADGSSYSNREIVEDLKNLTNHWYIEDYVYISEVPYYGEET